MHTLLQHIIWFFIKALICTYKMEIRGTEHRDKARKMHPKGSFIFALWHEQVIAVMNGHAFTEPYLALASKSKDGDYAAFVAKKMGFVPVRGSSRKKNRKDKGGSEALIEYVINLRNGTSGGLTVDGPKGPRHQCKPGIVVMSQKSGAPILPVAAVAKSYWEFNSWDKFKVPKPFTKIIMTYGEPILVDAEIPSEKIPEICEQVNQSLIKLTEASTI